jgi:AraC-like DNA-binding protein
VGWPEHGLHAKPNPFLVFVVEGTVDLSVGVIDGKAPVADKKPWCGAYTLRLPQKTALLHPPHVPITDGLRPHWNQPHCAQPDSTLLWLDITLEGAILHTCHTRNQEHSLGPYHFIFDVHLSSLLDSLIEEMQLSAKTPASAENLSEISRTLLELILLRIARSLAEQKTQRVMPDFATRIAQDDRSGEATEGAARSAAVQRACHFIQGRLNHPLTVERIAEQAFVSTAQLNRLFRSEMGRSVMEYVSEQRLKKAQSLLKNTSLAVNVISESVGFKNAVYFSRMFREKTGHSPLQYRLRHR